MEQIVLVSESVVVYMNNLVQELYDAEYFSYKESARDYVNKLYDFIYNDLPHITHYKTPEELKHYGNY